MPLARHAHRADVALRARQQIVDLPEVIALVGSLRALLHREDPGVQIADRGAQLFDIVHLARIAAPITPRAREKSASCSIARAEARTLDDAMTARLQAPEPCRGLCASLVGASLLVLGCGAAAAPSGASTAGPSLRAPDHASERARSSSADDDAAALFSRVNLEPDELASLSLRIDPTDDLATYINRFVASAQIAHATAERLANRFDQVIAVGSPRWTTASYVRQAQIYEALASCMVDAMTGPRVPRFAPDDSTARALRPVGGWQAHLEAGLQHAIRPQVDPLECRAVVRYLLAIRESRLSAIDSPEATLAAERLSTYPQGRVDVCFH